MSTQERRGRNRSGNGRRTLADRRNGDDGLYDGVERRSGKDRRVIVDRRR